MQDLGEDIGYQLLTDFVGLTRNLKLILRDGLQEYTSKAADNFVWCNTEFAQQILWKMTFLRYIVCLWKISDFSHTKTFICIVILIHKQIFVQCIVQSWTLGFWDLSTFILIASYIHQSKRRQIFKLEDFAPSEKKKKLIKVNLE